MNRRQFLKLSIAAGAIGLVGSYPMMIEPHMVQVNRYRVPIEGLPDQFNGFQVVHLTDLHFGFWMPSRFLKNVIRKANALRGDIIVCTGDYAHHRKSIQEVDEVWPILSRLDARQGVYSVLGNHDHWAGAESLVQMAEEERAGSAPQSDAARKIRPKVVDCRRWRPLGGSQEPR
ncbi:MAG: metallophosphoesterase [Syntrophobacteraceae bacterium]